MYEQQKDVSTCYGKETLSRSRANPVLAQFDNAKSAYQRVLERDPNHAKVLQQLGWLYHNQSSSFSSQDRAIEYLEKSVAAG